VWVVLRVYLWVVWKAVQTAVPLAVCWVALLVFGSADQTVDLRAVHWAVLLAAWALMRADRMAHWSADSMAVSTAVRWVASRVGSLVVYWVVLKAGWLDTLAQQSLVPLLEVLLALGL
jgi:hypothetical protein